MVRQPVVAGQFYPGQKAALKEIVQRYLAQGKPQPALGVVSPHAGYIYSGAIAGQVFSATQVPDRVIILGPNHHGLGHPAAVFAKGSWLTPLGETAIDEQLCGRLLAGCPLLAEDEVAHGSEHSLEVQLPFIQALAPHATIVPICIGHNGLEDLLRIGQDIGRVLKGEKEDVLVVASSDMTHYESAHDARTKDRLALDRILALDPEGLYRVVMEKGISMCGVMPVVVMLTIALELDASKATLVRYGNSGEVTGDETEVVGYAGLTVS